MPPPLSLDTYPAVFEQACLRAFEQGEFIILARTSSADALRLQMYGYLRALRAAGRIEMADAVYIAMLPDRSGIKLLHREKSPVALDIAASLETPPGEDKLPGDSFFDKLG